MQFFIEKVEIQGAKESLQDLSKLNIFCTNTI